MMRGVPPCVLAAGFAVLTAYPAFAEPGGFFGVMPAPNAFLVLRDEKAQADLKLSDEQKAAFGTIRDRYKDDFDRAREARDYKKISELLKQTGDEVEKAAPDILRADQLKRLRQLEIQATAQHKGLDVFGRDDVRAALKLTDRQTKEIAEAAGNIEKDAQDLVKDARGDLDKMRDAYRKILAKEKAAVDKVVEGMGDDQKKAWKDLTGEAFEFSPFRVRPPGGDENPREG